MARHFFISTMGCQMNEYDSDYLRQCLLGLDFRPVEGPEKADLILINTCTVREKAEQKAVSLLGRLISLKRRNPSIILGIVGCLAQQKGSDLLRRFPDLDLVLGTREVGRISEVLERIIEKREKIVATDVARRPPPPSNNGDYFEGRIKSHVSIMEGCDNFCSYCIVPYVRGRETSRPADEIIDEIERLIEKGVKEVTLLGQNVNSYQSSEGVESAFPELLRKVSRLKGLLRIRFTTSHPKDLSEKLIQCFVDLENLCPHLHLPVQAGSNDVLKRMNRAYTREKYFELVDTLRGARPDIAITSDVIVGFPGESEKDFQLTLDLVKKIEFDNLFSFKYSDRIGTRAENMGGKVGEKEKSSRLSELQELQREITFKKNQDLEGKEAEILVEGPSKKGGHLTGRTITNKIVNFACNDRHIGSIVKVEIKRAFFNSLWGEIKTGTQSNQ